MAVTNNRAKGEPYSAADQELARLAKAIGHPTRVAILRFLCTCGGCICGGIVDQLPFAQATISQHLKVLKEAGLIQGEIDGPAVCYCPDPQAIARLKTLLATLQPREIKSC
ncbi:MAG TPA: metalloregulator ArsR/SmtB family transcription factor [Candidatus Udaeobacter sp.]|nr:metalloregulator ArsR/SmtB family transcription factor [Candidatus Udaeobacter sp.]